MTQLRNQKDQLAKLMATEDLTIVHKKIPTAYFDMKNRILACPIFKDDISSELYDLFMGHEVGHALHTPYEGVHSALTKNKTLKGYLNVVEDVRIERKIREKYQGLRKSFYTAYDELMGMDFFGIKKRNLQELSLIDKINLITKVGSRVVIKLTKEEQEFLDWSMRCETWDEVEECATAIYEWSKENETRTEEDEDLVPQTLNLDDEDEDEDEDGDSDGNEWGDEEEEDSEQDGSGGDSDDEDTDEEDGDSLPDAVDQNDGDQEDDAEEGDLEDDAEKQTKTTGGKEGGTATSDMYDDENGARESITEHNAHNNEDQFLSEENIVKSLIDVAGKFKQNDNYTKQKVSYKQVNEDWNTFWNFNPEKSYWDENRLALAMKRAQRTSKTLTDNNKKLVNHMAKEFEMKQTALRSSKAVQGKTGKLDMNRLAKYQIIDDVFKKVTMLPDGKNHGLNVMLDWSGSIHGEVMDLLEQTIILVQFCRKVQIPHRVYLFSDSYARGEGDDWGSGTGKLIEIFSNEMSLKDYNKMMINVSSLYNNYFAEKGGYRGFSKLLKRWNEWFVGIENFDEDNRWTHLESYAMPDGFRLGGTPLDHCLVAMRTELPKFNSQYGIEKSILTVITDGYSHSSPTFEQSDAERKDVAEQSDGDEWSYRGTRVRQFLDPFSKKLYPYSSGSGYRREYFDQTTNILEWLSAECNVTITGYFVLSKKNDLWGLSSELTDVTLDVDDAWKDIRKVGLCVRTKGYNKLFLTSASTLGTAGEDELDEKFIGAKKSSVMAAFKRNQRSKTTSRFLTNEFIKEIA